MGIAAELKKNFREEKARLEGKAISRARMIRQAKDIPGLAEKLTPGEGVPRSTGTGVRMMDGKTMVFYTDGSVRHVLGKRLIKAERKALKRARRANAKKSS
jgi:hypothetical protein